MLFNFSTNELIVTDIKEAIREWNGGTILSDVLSPEFGGSEHDQTGIAFGEGRKESVSIFCFKDGEPDSKKTEELFEYLKRIVGPLHLDFAKQYGFIAIHNQDPRSLKGKVLRAIGWALYLQGKQCWMIGNSLNDLAYCPALCSVGIVASKDNPINGADLQTTLLNTDGVIELVGSIIID